MIIQDPFGTIQNLQRALIPQTSNWSGTIFCPFLQQTDSKNELAPKTFMPIYTTDLHRVQDFQHNQNTEMYVKEAGNINTFYVDRYVLYFVSTYYVIVDLQKYSRVLAILNSLSANSEISNISALYISNRFYFLIQFLKLFSNIFPAQYNHNVSQYNRSGNFNFLNKLWYTALSFFLVRSISRLQCLYQIASLKKGKV